jgi:hypothetical protein
MHVISHIEQNIEILSMVEAEGVQAPSYNNVVANKQQGGKSSRPVFESPPHIREQLLRDEQRSGKEMDVEADTSHPKVNRMWEPGKCIPQTNSTPRYVIISTRIGENAQFMKEHELIGKNLGLWPLEWDLMKWIKTWWNPKGHYNL